MDNEDLVFDAATEARSKAQEASTEIEFMKRDIERLLMITEALWGILKKEHGYSDDQLRQAITEIDLRDGHLDGRVRTKEKFTCPSCGRVVSIRHASCMYCGQKLEHDPFVR